MIAVSGPVGISDGLGETDALLIGQAFVSHTDSTLLRPSRPLSTVDAVFRNKSVYPPTPPPPPPPPPIPPGSMLLKATANTQIAGCTSEQGKTGCCFDLGWWNKSDGAVFSTNGCHPDARGNNQLFQHNMTTQQLIINLDGKCLTATSTSSQITATTCKPGSSAQKWAFTSNGQLKNSEYGCATAASNPMRDGSGLKLAPCSATSTPLQAFAEVKPAEAEAEAEAEAARAGASLYNCDAEYGSCVVGTSDDNTGNDVRSTHAALPGGGPNSHYVLAWMTTHWVTLQSTDLYPRPATGTKLAIREHYNKMPAGMPVTAGCEDGKPARNCIEMLAADEAVVMPPTGGNITDYTYIAVYEPASNGAYFLGELNKFVHVSPQRFESVLVKGTGACGLTVSAKGTAGTTITLIAVDPKSIVHVANVTFPGNGVAEVVM